MVLDFYNKSVTLLTMKVHPNDKTMFAVYTNTDLTEGRGQEYPFAFCDLEATAKRLAKGRYVQGTDCTYREVDVYFINGAYYYPGGYIERPTPEDQAEELVIFEKKRKLDAKTAAIAKAKALGLTEEEIAALR